MGKVSCLIVMTVLMLAAAPPATKPANSTAAGDVAALQGKWKTALIKSNGRDVTAQNSYEFKVVNDTTVIHINGEDRVSHFKLNPAKAPKEIDWTAPNGKTLLGVYEIDGDTWKVHLARVGQERVKDLTEDTGTFYRYERVKG